VRLATDLNQQWDEIESSSSQPYYEVMKNAFLELHDTGVEWANSYGRLSDQSEENRKNAASSFDLPLWSGEENTNHPQIVAHSPYMRHNLRLYFPDGAPPETTEISKTFIEVIEFLQYNEISGEYEKVYDTGEHIELNFEINGPGSTYSKTDKILDPSNEILEKAAYPAPDDPITTPIPLRIFLLPVELEKISFDGTEYYELKKDDLTETYSAPHWIKADATNESVAFKRNSKPEVEAFFKLDAPDDLLAKIKIKGVASDGVEFPEQALVRDGGSVKYPMKEASSAFPKAIKFYDRDDDAKAFKIDWQISIDGGAFTSIGESKHQVYLTLEKPVTALRQETLFYLGAKNADGDNAEAAARDSMYSEFTDRNVKRLDEVQMTYWANNDDGEAQMGCVDTPGLLVAEDGNGNCQSWGGLFRDILRVHGIDADRIRVWPKAGDSSVIVKDWRFEEPPSGPPRHPYIEGLNAFDLPGIPGQGNPDPPRVFNGHWITKSGGHYYDPSYGTPAVKEGNIDKKYEDGAFDGFGEIYETSGGGAVRGIRKNNSGDPAASEVDYFLAN
jgi:hypothetical protein